MNELKITIKDYEKRNPCSNKVFFDNLSNDVKQKYLDMHALYIDLFIQYMNKKYNLKKYDDYIKNSKSNFKNIDIINMDLYQYLSSKHFSYIYIRNNVYIERLNKEEFSFLKQKLINDDYNLDEKTFSFVENTFQKILFEITDNDIYDVCYGEDLDKFLKPNNALIIGVRVDEFNKENNINDEIWIKKYREASYELDLIIDYLEFNLSKKINVPCFVIKYNDFSINKIEINIDGIDDIEVLR